MSRCDRWPGHPWSKGSPVGRTRAGPTEVAAEQERDHQLLSQ